MPRIYNIDDKSAQIIRHDHALLAGRGRIFPTPQRRRRGGGGGGSFSSVDITFVLIDQDILGISEDDPTTNFDTAGLLTADEILAGWTIVLQDPPNDNYDLDNVSALNLWAYKTKQVSLKYYTEDPLTVSDSVQSATLNTVTLAGDVSEVDNYYIDDIITVTSAIGAAQSQTITAYDGGLKKVTVENDWTTTPDTSYTYEISSSNNSKLVTTTITDNDTKRKIVRYATTVVYYVDGKDFKVGEYTKVNYPDYPEDETFPPDGTGTYAVPPEGFLNKRYRGIAINNVLVTALCKVLPPPNLVLV